MTPWTNGLECRRYLKHFYIIEPAAHDLQPDRKTVLRPACFTLIGVAIEAVGNGAGETVGRVRLNASF